MNLRINKLPIYKGVACVELLSPHGPKWWYAGAGLSYSPVLVKDLRDLRRGHLPSRGQDRMVAHVQGLSAWLAINLARTDIAALRSAGLWSAGHLEPPFDAIEYSAWPAYTKSNPSCASARLLVSG